MNIFSAATPRKLANGIRKTNDGYFGMLVINFQQSASASVPHKKETRDMYSLSPSLGDYAQAILQHSRSPMTLAPDGSVNRNAEAF